MASKLRLPTALLLSLFLGLGCKSISASLTSPSDSISGSYEVIAGSFGALSDGISTSCSGRSASSSELALGEDVRVFTLSLAREQRAAELLPGLAHVSAPHGVTDFGAIPSVWHGVGVGLAQSELPEEALEGWLAQAGVTEGASITHVREGFEVALR
ncbi:MAG: hypothetical protein QNK05_18570 [Myxococcota bacterium]|nr:hypothetical protein [Myxococcota bacterium]